jgi:hypothetical protein
LLTERRERKKRGTNKAMRRKNFTEYPDSDELSVEGCCDNFSSEPVGHTCALRFQRSPYLCKVKGVKYR